ncbi:hypothetical protein DFS33DRAFT_1387561 [Desarmillaria ectypa]|nr:hypothetical protein DFS33DRAFT_1387561 [Desarmillaria ectypa]
MLQVARKYGAGRSAPVKFIFTSSLAVNGSILPDVVPPDMIATPKGAYGMGKLTSELLVNEFPRYLTPQKYRSVTTVNEKEGILQFTTTTLELMLRTGASPLSLIFDIASSASSLKR